MTGALPAHLATPPGESRVFRLALGVAVLAHLGLLALRLPVAERTPAIPDQARDVPIVRILPELPPPPPADITLPPITCFGDQGVVPLPPAEPLPRPAADDAVVPFELPDRAEVPDAPPPRPMATPEVVRVGVDVAPPVVLLRVEPRNTNAAIAARKEGAVVVDLVIGTDGYPRSVKVLRDLGFGLGRSAADAVRQWRFEPMTVDGRPVEVRYTLTVWFRLQ